MVARTAETGFGAPVYAAESPPSDWGFGSPIPSSWGLAEADTGFGSPIVFVVGAAVVSGAGAGEFADEGGAIVEITGAWPVVGPYTVTLIDAAGGTAPAYSAVPGQGAACQTDVTQERLRFALPPLATGAYDVRVQWSGGDQTFEGLVIVVPRARPLDVYAGRARIPFESYPRGASLARDEPYVT